MNSAVSRTVIVVIVIWVARVPATIVRTGVVWSLWEVIGPTVKCLSQWFPEACGLYHLGSCLCCGQTQRGCLGREARGRAKRNARVRDTDDGCCTFTGTLDCCEFCGEMCFYWCYLTCVFAGDDICCCSLLLLLRVRMRRVRRVLQVRGVLRVWRLGLLRVRGLRGLWRLQLRLRVRLRRVRLLLRVTAGCACVSARGALQCRNVADRGGGGGGGALSGRTRSAAATSELSVHRPRVRLDLGSPAHGTNAQPPPTLHA